MKSYVIGLMLFLAAEAFAGDSLGLVFPFERRGDQVFLKHAVLLNENCLLQKGAQARIMFIMPRAEDADVKKIQRRAESNPAFSRAPYEPKSQSNDDHLTAKQQAILDRALSSTWKEEVSFRSALERWNLEDARFVFQQPGSADPKIERVDPPEGMLLAEVGHAVVILDVQKESSAEAAGFQGNTVLLSLNGKVFSSLEQFQKIYLDEKEKTRTLSFLAQLPSGEQKNVEIKRPLSLNSDIWSEMEKK